MSPDDDRHGTYAGAHAHAATDKAPCGRLRDRRDPLPERPQAQAPRGEMVDFPPSASPDASPPPSARIPHPRSEPWPASAPTRSDRSATTAPDWSTHAPPGRHRRLRSAVHDPPRGPLRATGPARWHDDAAGLPRWPTTTSTTPTSSRKGWPNLSQPTPSPGPHRRPSSATHYLEHANDHRHTLARVSTDLGITEDALWTWCRRNGRRDLWEAFKGREKDWAEATNRRVA